MPRAAAGTLVVFGILAALDACVPWTVRPLGEAGEAQSSSGGKFDARAYVDSLWQTRLIPAMESSAVDLADLAGDLATRPLEAARRHARRDGDGPYWFVVRGRARIIGVDMSSRAGLAQLDFAPFDGQADATLALGPVIRGSAVRDATGLVPFNRFVNQLDYADVSNLLNQRVVEGVVDPVRPRLTPGAIVSLLGAFRMDAADAVAPFRPEIVAVRLQAGGE